jgi:hypothetical protein
MQEKVKILMHYLPEGLHAGSDSSGPDGCGCETGLQARARVRQTRAGRSAPHGGQHRRVRQGIHPLLPVYTSAPFPKGRINDLQNFLRDVEIPAPVEMGAVVVANVLDSGVDILASRDMEVSKRP